MTREQKLAALVKATTPDTVWRMILWAANPLAYPLSPSDAQRLLRCIVRIENGDTQP